MGGDTDVRPVRLARSCRIAAALVVVALGAGACGSPNDGVGAELDELRAQVDELETQLAEISTTTAVLETTTTPATTTTTLPATTTTTDVTIEYADPATIRVFGAEVGRDMIGRRLFEQELVAMVAAMHAQQRAAFLVGQSFDLEARMILYLADRFVEEIEALRRRGQVIAACEGPLGNHPDMRDTCAGLRP